MSAPEPEAGSASSRRRLALLVGVAAILAPALHTVTDVMELAQGGFSRPQRWTDR